MRSIIFFLWGFGNNVKKIEINHHLNLVVFFVFAFDRFIIKLFPLIS